MRQPETVLALQRSAGNHAVARLLARAPARDVDPESDSFWKDIAGVAESQLTRWVENEFGVAVDQFESDLTLSEEDGGLGSFALDTFLTLLPFAGENGEIAAAVIEIAKGIYEQLPLEEPVDLRAFLEKARTNQVNLSRLVTDHQGALFDALDLAQAQEEAGFTGTDRRDAIAAELGAAMAKLPTFKQMRAALTVDWMAASNDGWDFDSEAGCVVLTVLFPSAPPIPQPPAYSISPAPYLEDVSRPAGVLESLKSSFGEKTHLELLPIETVAYVTMGDSFATLRNPGIKDFRTRGKADWQYESGAPEILDAWRSAGVYPTLGDMA